MIIEDPTLEILEYHSILGGILNTGKMWQLDQLLQETKELPKNCTTLELFVTL